MRHHGTSSKHPLNETVLSFREVEKCISMFRHFAAFHAIPVFIRKIDIIGSRYTRLGRGGEWRGREGRGLVVGEVRMLLAGVSVLYR